MKYYYGITLIIIFILFPVYSYSGERTVNIIYTGSLNGELEPCGCSPKTDFGGMARLSGFLNDQGDRLSPYVLIDAGNFTSKDTPQGRLKADAMLKSFTILKYDAVALLLNEQAFAEGFLESVIKEYKIPALSFPANYKQSVLISRGGVNVHVSVDPEDFPENTLNVLLTDHPVQTAVNIRGWDVIISSYGEELEEPLSVNETVLVSGYPGGMKTGVLAIKVNDEGKLLGFEHSWLQLGSDIREDPRVRSVLNDYDMKVAELLKTSQKPLPGTTYLGVSRCAECHQSYVESWEKTRHAGAFASLEHAGKESDPECIVCHSVGFGEKGGFFTIEATPELANVQCEECHGLDREHLDDYSRPMKPVSEKVCLKCHTKANSPDFNYSVYYEKIKH